MKISVTPVLGLLFAGIAGAQVSVLTGQYDTNRSSANLGETILNTSNVNATQFGLLFTRSVDAYIFAQPLYVPNLTIQGAAHNVVFVATLNNTVYAFDADSPSASAPLWKTSLGTPVSIPNYAGQPSIGILSTPVIDAGTDTMYVVTLTSESGSWVYRLHAVNILTGAEIMPSSVVQGSVPGTGDNSQNVACPPNGTVEPCVPFVAKEQQQRTALLESNGDVYFGFGTLSPREDTASYHGWLFGYSTGTLQLTSIFNSSPNTGTARSQPPCTGASNPCGHAGGIWMAGRGPAADSTGIYFVTGNGGYDAAGNYGESVVRMSSSGQALDSFTPGNYAKLNQQDLDFGGGGEILLPGNLLVAMGKSGMAYLLNRAALGGLTTGNTGALQSFNASAACSSSAPSASGCYEILSPAFWGPSGANPVLYVWAWGDTLRAWDLVNSQFVPDANPVGPVAAPYFPGGGLAVSASGSAAGTGIVWALLGTSNASPNAGALYAFNAANISQQLWVSSANPKDGTWAVSKFLIPTVANGKVYVPTSSDQLRVYGLCSPSTPCYPASNSVNRLQARQE
jgi:hypothetical protein